MPLYIPARIAALAFVAATQWQHDFSTAENGTLHVGAGVADGDVAGLGFNAAQFVGLAHVGVEVRLPDRNEHDGAAAMDEFGVNRRSVGSRSVAGIDKCLLLKAERSAQPLGRRRNIAVAHNRNKAFRNRLSVRRHLCIR